MPLSKMKILIAAKQNPAGIRAAKKAEKELSKFAEVHFDRSTALRLHKWKTRGMSIKRFDGDMIVTLGGDGTFLWTAYQARVPILPVRIEGHGFLCTTDMKELLKNTETIKAKKYRLMERMRLRVQKVKPGLMSRIFHGTSFPLSVNEVAFARKRPSKILNVEFAIDGTKFEFVGDGVLFATPSGSTGYSASAGGSLLDPSLEAIGVIPLYPFHSPIKPMAIPAHKKIEVKVKSNCSLIIDGHTGEYISEGEQFVIEKGDPVQVVTFSDINFYERYKNAFLEGKFVKEKW